MANPQRRVALGCLGAWPRERGTGVSPVQNPEKAT